MQLWLIDVRFPVLQFLFRPRDGFCRRQPPFRSSTPKTTLPSTLFTFICTSKTTCNFPSSSLSIYPQAHRTATRCPTRCPIRTLSTAHRWFSPNSPPGRSRYGPSLAIRSRCRVTWKTWVSILTVLSSLSRSIFGASIQGNSPSLIVTELVG